MSAPANFGDTRPLIEPDHATMLLIDQPGGLFEDGDGMEVLISPQPESLDVVLANEQFVAHRNNLRARLRR